jgi:hypothetical protein
MLLVGMGNGSQTTVHRVSILNVFLPNPPGPGFLRITVHKDDLAYANSARKL